MASGAAHSRHCGACYEDPSSLLSVENILQCQKVSDFLISLAYFSIPLELFYFATCSTIFPFRWVLLLFGAFIVLCGLTHLAAAFTYAQHSFLLMLALTVFKFLTALVSVATAVTLVTLIPQLLRLFLREGLLRKKTHELDREVGIIRRQEEAGWHVRMLTREIRRSLDRHTILETTLVELSKLLFLEYCGILMPAGTTGISPTPSPRHLVLTHEMGRRRGGTSRSAVFVPIDDLDVASVIGREKAVLLHQGSTVMTAVAAASGEALVVGAGEGVAIRMPLLSASNFRGLASEKRDASYALLVLVLPADSGRTWTEEELEVVEVVADQVAVALSHAAVLEDSLLMKRQLLKQNAMLKAEQKKALMAKKARALFQKVLSCEIAKPLRFIKACLAILQDEKLKIDLHAMVRGGLTLSSFMEGVMELMTDQSELELKLRPFNLHSVIEDIGRLSSLFCALRGLSFQPRIPNGAIRRVVGDESRILQVLLCMVGYVVGCVTGGAAIVLHVSFDRESQATWKQNAPDDDDFLDLSFKVGRTDSMDEEDSNQKIEDSGQQVCLSLCKRLAELMHGNLSISSESQGFVKNIRFQLRIKKGQTEDIGMPPRCLDQETALNLLGSMKVLLADSDSMCRTLGRRVLQRAGCNVTLASSWLQCLNFFNFKGSRFHLLLLDIQILVESGDISRRIKKLRLDSCVRIIALATRSDSVTSEECLQSGIIHGILYKPIILQEMLEELQRISQQSLATPSVF